MQLESCRQRAERGEFLPRDFKFDPHASQCCAPAGGAEWSLSNSMQVDSEGSSLSLSVPLTRPSRRTTAANTPRNATANLPTRLRQAPLSAPNARPLVVSAFAEATSTYRKLNTPKIVVHLDDSGTGKLPAILKEHTF